MEDTTRWCDRCGSAIVGPTQLALDGSELCRECVEDDVRWLREARKREASTDGR